MPRTQVSPVQVREGLQPQAQPVDTFVRTEDPAPSPLHELAAALDNFGHGLESFANKATAQKAKGEDVRGKAAAYKNSGLDYAEAVRRGVIPTYSSPEFIQSYKEGQGEILGKQIASKFSTEYQAWGGRYDTDQAGFDKFLGDFIKQNLTVDDPDILKGAMPFVQGLTEQGYTINNTDRNNALKKSALDTNIANMRMNLDNADDMGVMTGQGTDYNQLWDGLVAGRQQALDVGMDPTTYDKQWADMIASAAIDHGDPQLLELLAKKMPGQEFAYKDTPEGQDLYSKTKTALVTAGAERSRLQADAQAKADKAQDDKNKAFIVNNLAKDPNAAFDEDWLDKASALDPTIRNEILGWRKNFDGAANAEDENAILHIQAGILDGSFTMSDLLKEMGDGGSIHDKDTASKLITMLNQRADDSMKPLLSNDIYQQSLKQIDNAFPDPQNGDPGLINQPRIAARLDYQKAMIGWFAANPNATALEIMDQSAKTLKLLNVGVVQNDQTGQNDYQTPQGIGSDGQPTKPGATDANGRPAPDTGLTTPNPLVKPQQQVQNENAAQPAPDGLDVFRGEAPPTFDTLSDEQKKRVTQESDARGISPKDYLAILWGNFNRIDPGAKTQDGQLLDNQKPTGPDGGAVQPSGPDNPLPAPEPLQPAAGDNKVTAVSVDPAGVQLQAVGPSHPGTPDNNFDTVLTGKDEMAFQKWKAKYAPNDSGEDYDLRGAFAAGILPDPKTGHWPDTFKKPNEPTFSDQSQYAKYGNPGSWNGDTFVPGTKSDYAPEPAKAPALDAINQATSTDPMKVWGGDAPPTMADLSNDQKASITAEATRLDEPAADVIADLYYRHKADQQGANMTTPEAAGALTLSKLVGKTEGTAKARGYDEVIGYGQFGGKDVKVSTMTIGDVKKLQKKMVANGAPSGAVGMYQIINKTLTSLQKTLNLPDNAIFDPTVQDEMFVELLRQRGLDRFKAGKLSATAFADNLSKEWASLPFSNGKSFYGQGVGTTRAKLLAAIKAIGVA